MVNLKQVRENPDLIRADIKKRHSSFDVESLISKDKQWRESLQEMEKLKAQRNVVTKEIATQKDDKKIAEMKIIKEKIKEIEDKTEKLDKEGQLLLTKCPNLMNAKVPAGKDESENPEVKRWGKIEKKNFEIKNHADLMEAAGIANFEKAAEVAGRGFNYLKGDMVLLDQALQRFAMEFLVSKKGFTPVFPPFMLNRKAYEGVIDFSDFENVIYKIENEDLYCIATSEHPLMALYANEVVAEQDLPIKNMGISACFRKEIGAHTVDTRGLFRMHQFNKIEQTVICKPEDSEKYLEELQRNVEEIYEQLEIPYRVIEICAGDLSIKNSRQYDIEAWFPRQNKYGEVGSTSNCTDFQSQRLNIKYGKQGGEKNFTHTLNATAMATSRGMTAILENFQNEDGTVTVPKVLRPYILGKEVIGKA